jgi:two-component sensor histidine kinase
MSEQEEKKKSPQEILNALQETYQQRMQAVADIKDQLIAAQDAQYKSYRELVAANEQYMINIIQSQEKQLKRKPDTPEPQSQSQT